MTIKFFPWETIGQINELDIQDISHTVKHPYGAGYHASRPEGTKMQKEFKLVWWAMSEAQWLALVRFWRSVVGDAEAFHFEYPIVVDDWDLGNSSFSDPPTDGFDLELDDSSVSGDKPIFLVNFTGNKLQQTLRKDILPERKFTVTTSVREVS